MEHAIAAFVEHYNQQRYHESLDNITPADVLFGRAAHIRDTGAGIKQQTFALRRSQHLLAQTAL